jgi:ABC-type multidrug transport system fused ATPase/permease subunit
MEVLRKIIFVLSQKERTQALIVLMVILVTAFFDMIGVASIMPFIALLANPELIETNFFLNMLYGFANDFGIHDTNQFIFLIGVSVFILLLVSLSAKAFSIYLQTRFVFMSEYSIGARLVQGYLSQPYSWFLMRNSADLGKNIVSEVAQVINYAIGPVANIISSGATIIAILLLLLFIDVTLTISIMLVLGLAYGLIYMLYTNKLQNIGNERVEVNEARFKALSEGFGAIKEVILARCEHMYLQRYALPAKTYSQHMATATIIANIPRFVLEVIAFGGLMIVILYLMAENNDFASTIPVVTLYAFAGYRLMPALQQLYSSATQLRFSGSALDVLIEELKSVPQKSLSSIEEPITLNTAIELTDVTYHYSAQAKAAVKNISLTIPAGSKVGFVGGTGGGKTTTVDLILGLLEAHQGSLKVDGKLITGRNCSAWQASLGYVPQNIYLADDTVAANIAFGTAPEDIDQAAVERVAKIASLHEFVINQLPQKYNTEVGERGVRLSGGQRQRIGIARALYHNPQVLILDEATSALDNLTEQAVMEAVHNLGPDITIILIAHRLSTVKECDIIFVLESGELKDQGNYDELALNSETFRSLLQKRINKTL